MSDIVKRLNALVIMDEVGSNNQLGKEAAAYIERLEAALTDIENRVEYARNSIHDASQWDESEDGSESLWTWIFKNARAALQTGGA